jgi:D-alanine-D-alanine ligase
MSGNKQRIGVLVDGWSQNRETSLMAGEAIVRALAEGGHEARKVFVDRDLDLILRQDRIDLAFLALRGRYGGDGCLQGLLEVLGIPYTGSGVLASALAMHRAKGKEILRLHNLPTAPAYLLRADSDRPLLANHGAFGYPVLVSPASTGLCVTCCLARDELELESCVEEAFRFGDEVLVERFIDGRLVTVAVLDGMPLGMLELGRTAELSTGSLRAAAEPYREHALARGRLSVARRRALLRLGQLACEALGVEGAALVEMVVSDRYNEIVRGVDVSPALTPSSAFPQAAIAAGLSFSELVEEILHGARLRAHGRRRDRRALQIPFAGPERRSGSLVLPLPH